MPQGDPTRIPPQPGVLLYDPLTSDDGGLLASSDNIIQRYGRMEARPGLQALGMLPAGEHALGATWIRDKGGAVNLILASDRALYKYNTTLRVLESLKTGAAPTLTGNLACPTTFTYFEQGSLQYAVCVNGIDPAMEHEIGTPTYQAVPTGYIARSICTVANRLFYGSPIMGGELFPTMVCWSAALDRTSHPALARQPLIDSADHIIAVRRGLRTIAYIYRENSIWTATARAASDSRAFSFDIAWQGPGPVGPMAIGDDQGFRHAFFAVDLNLYTFDGNSVELLAPTANVLDGRFNPAAGALTSVTYDQIHGELIVTLPLDGDAIPTHQIRYSYLTKGVFPATWNRLHPVTMTGSWQVELETATCQLPDVPTCELPNVVTCRLGFTPGQQSVVVGCSETVAMHEGTADLGEAIPTIQNYLLPFTPGQEHEFDGVEIMAPQSCPPMTVSVLVGHTFDLCTTELPLGIINPAIVPPAYLEGPPADVAGGPNVARVLSRNHLRGRAVIVRIRTASATTRAQIRRIEVALYTRRRAA